MDEIPYQDVRPRRRRHLREGGAAIGRAEQAASGKWRNGAATERFAIESADARCCGGKYYVGIRWVNDYVAYGAAGENTAGV